jgi:RHS repeat-associated protein
VERQIVWFAGLPVAQIDYIPHLFQLPEPETRYLFTDHLGTPILQTDDAATITWQAEYEPYGRIYTLRAGAPEDQLLRLPGQEATVTDGVEESDYYNIFRWYRAGWGRYTQADPLAIVEPTLFVRQGMPAYRYASDNPVRFIDPMGLQASNCCDCPGKTWSYKGGSAGFGFLVGLTYARGTYTCDSKPSLKVMVQTTCVQKGFFANLGASFDTSVLPFLPAAKACKATELYDPDPSSSPFGSLGIFGTSGMDGVGTVSIGPSLGAGFGAQDCYASLYKRHRPLYKRPDYSNLYDGQE